MGEYLCVRIFVCVCVRVCVCVCKTRKMGISLSTDFFLSRYIVWIHRTFFQIRFDMKSF